MHFGIIAAGEGSRLAQEGVNLPKPLVDLDGRPMIGRLISLMVQAGAESISVIVNEQSPEVKAALEAMTPGVPMRIVVKSTPSSMHSFYELSQTMRGLGRFVLTTVDTIFRAPDFLAYTKAFAEAGADTDGMMGVTSFVDDEKPLYVATDCDMRITAFTDSPTPETHFISGGIYGLGQNAIDVLDACMDRGVSRMRNYQRALVEAGLRLKAYPFGKIVDVDHASDIAGARAFIAGENKT